MLNNKVLNKVLKVLNKVPNKVPNKVLNKLRPPDRRGPSAPFFLNTLLNFFQNDQKSWKKKISPTKKRASGGEACFFFGESLLKERF